MQIVKRILLTIALGISIMLIMYFNIIGIWTTFQPNKVYAATDYPEPIDCPAYGITPNGYLSICKFPSLNLTCVENDSGNLFCLPNGFLK